VTAINELREPLHDEALSTVLRIEGDRLVAVDADFQRLVLGSELHSVKSAKRRADWVRPIRGQSFRHQTEPDSFLKRQEKSQRGVLEGRAKTALTRELAAAKESYQYRLRELKDRSREQELGKLAKVLVRQQAEAIQPTLFEEIQEEAKVRVQE